MSTVEHITHVVHGPLMMTIQDFAYLHGVSPSTVERCINGEPGDYPPLRIKRIGSKRFITAEAAAQWRDSLPDA